MPIHRALQACCQSERRGKQPQCFSLHRNKSTVSCNETTGTTVCCEDDLTQQTATRSRMMGRQMPCWAKMLLVYCHCHCLCVSLSLCTWVLMWRCCFKEEEAGNMATDPAMYTAMLPFLIWLKCPQVTSVQSGYKPSKSNLSCQVSSMSRDGVEWTLIDSIYAVK